MHRRLLAATLVALLAGLGGAGPVAADLAHPVVVSTNPVDFTPHVLDGTIWALAVVGDTVVVGGTFTQVTDRTRTTRYNRKNLFAYGLNDGVIRPFNPPVDGAVYALAAGAGNTVYVGGAFRNIAGRAQRGLARLSVPGGGLVPTFRAQINWGDVRAVAVFGNRFYAGGTFTAVNGVARTALARLDAGSGAVDNGFNASLSAPGLSRTRVEHFDLSRDGRRMVAVGAIRKAAGRDRVQLVMLDTSGPRAVVTDWYTDAFRPACKDTFETYLRQVKFSPDASYFVTVTTGRLADHNTLCDSAARFDTAGTGRHWAKWINATGGDSLYSVAVTGAAVYVGGHQRWMDNPYGRESAGPGSVERMGIGAINPVTGKALAWNPTRTRGVGPRALVPTAGGLIVGSDTDQLGGEYHGRLGMFPLR
ncbi:MAG TPA: PKD domain containing protein [Catenuloplanes sp.]|jgi:hypothetical protein